MILLKGGWIGFSAMMLPVVVIYSEEVGVFFSHILLPIVIGVWIMSGSSNREWQRMKEVGHMCRMLFIEMAYEIEVCEEACNIFTKTTDSETVMDWVPIRSGKWDNGGV